MRLFHRIAIGFIDKLIIGFALILVAMSTYGYEDIGPFITILAVVFFTYLGVMFFVNLATMGVVTKDGFTRIALAILVAGFVFWLYPLALDLIFLLLGVSLAIDVKTVLLWTIVIRSGIRFYLAKRWGLGGEE